MFATQKTALREVSRLLYLRGRKSAERKRKPKKRRHKRRLIRKLRKEAPC